MSLQPRIKSPLSRTLEKSLVIETSESVNTTDTEVESPVAHSYAPEWEYHQTATKSSNTTNKGNIPIPQPEVMQKVLYPITPQLQNKIFNDRTNVNSLLSDGKKPLLVITGPSHIKDTNQIKACAQYLSLKQGNSITSSDYLPSEIKSIFHDPAELSNLHLALRTNLTMYNHAYTSPQSQSIRTFEIDKGIPKCRSLLRELSQYAPLVSEFVDTLTPQYLADFYSMGIVGPTLIESQLHRELASGSSYAVGFSAGEKSDMLDHKLTSCLDSMYATSQPHQFLSITKYGTVAVVGTTGNSDTFVILPLGDDITELVAKVNSYKNLQGKTVKLLLDIGRVSNDDYETKLITLKSVLDSEVRDQILGVMIDSGDHYVPYDYQVDDREDVESLFTLVDRASSESLSFAPNSNYEYFINANNLLLELNNLNK
ncbi:uncharacterized protein SPAPADRAFT_57769 [Spathaspora passalidarum NRRL Y-27907]|uniref:3-deoxy-7-phosphoheptulonate synthase n=1 Tax=Spathaspora passalidarum (strain NRRL Y-27907 / 11-Y1) TaxID=619300 RepID=G3ADY1_SPAPN|nr:uncharacterized protein SPAPADRAFT_57769 [Spathaspora passalidarum NRRL Y-27907]EGW34705.1 hypothetical protein SPAPADRAFT_57769 [Spathaspora passalidarum NRRL Y-27907]